MDAKVKIADRDMACSRCKDHHIPTPTILAGDKYIQMSHQHKQFACCKDCFVRLAEECMES